MHRWAINPAALRLVQGWSVGDKATVTDDREVLARFHQNHAALANIAGCTGRVTHVHGEHQVVVDFGEGRVRTIHSGCLEDRGREAVDALNANIVKYAAAGDTVGVERALVAGVVNRTGFVLLPEINSVAAALYKAIGNGHDKVVQLVLSHKPELVNTCHQDKTPLMTAAHEGHSLLVDMIISYGGNPTVADSCGDTAMHYAAIGRKTDSVLTLVNKGADVNMVNSSRRTAVHIAVMNRDVATLNALLKVGADVSLQDINGDTALHVAIIGRDHVTVDILLEVVTDLLTVNNRGHNCLHLAALQGDPHIVSRILAKDRTLVNIVTRDGLSSLQLAAAVAAPVAVTALMQVR